MNNPPENEKCSICQGSFTAPFQANCSHWFCGSCIMQLWRYGSALRPCNCPLCRRPISLLVPSEETVRGRNDTSVSEVLHDVGTYNRVFGGRLSGLVQRMQDLPFLLRRLLREMMDPQRTLPLVIRARVSIALILSAVYIISPIDIIPEGDSLSHPLTIMIGLVCQFLLCQEIRDQRGLEISKKVAKRK